MIEQDHAEPSLSDFIDTLANHIERSPRNTLRTVFGNLLSHGVLEKTPETIQEIQGKLVLDGATVGSWLSSNVTKDSHTI